MKIRTIRYFGFTLALLAVGTFFFSSSILSDAKAGAGDRSKGDKSRIEGAAPEAVFTNATPIAINDADIGTPYPSDIAVSGLGGTITSVKVTLNGYSHTFPDDMGMVLVGPTGAALLIQDGAGDDPDMANITYSIADSGATDLPNLTAWAAGTYQPTTYYTNDSFPAPGPGTTYGSPGPTGGGTATFASVFNGTAPNGTWHLYVVDFVAGDDGDIAGGWSIEITTNGPAVNVQHISDFNGDGKTDWSLVRNTGGGPGGQLTWFIQQNLNGSNGPITYQVWGSQGDEFVPNDYDGDGKTDIAIWRPTETNFYILQSQTATLRAEQFGIPTDDPSIVDDYDGDGKCDLAVYRAGVGAGAPSRWFWRTTAGGPAFARIWGQNGDFPSPGDYDNDGKADFVIQRNAGGGQAAFWANYSSAAPGVISRYSIFGTPTDVILPGDYDGDGKTDYCVIRSIGGAIGWFYEPSTALNTFIGGPFGISATDFPATGDYDGDGKTDFAVWRPDVTPSNNFFYVRRSADGTLLANEWGQNGDYPPANYNNH
jgi:subtilisin-like proprotein convertase family protein